MEIHIKTKDKGSSAMNFFQSHLIFFWGGGVGTILVLSFRAFTGLLSEVVILLLNSHYNVIHATNVLQCCHESRVLI